jgi:hypothetical protein
MSTGAALFRLSARAFSTGTQNAPTLTTVAIAAQEAIYSIDWPLLIGGAAERPCIAPHAQRALGCQRCADRSRRVRWVSRVKAQPIRACIGSLGSASACTSPFYRTESTSPPAAPQQCSGADAARLFTGESRRSQAAQVGSGGQGEEAGAWRGWGHATDVARVRQC